MLVGSHARNVAEEVRFRQQETSISKIEIRNVSSMRTSSKWEEKMHPLACRVSYVDNTILFFPIGSGTSRFSRKSFLSTNPEPNKSISASITYMVLLERRNQNQFSFFFPKPVHMNDAKGISSFTNTAQIPTRHFQEIHPSDTWTSVRVRLRPVRYGSVGRGGPFFHFFF